ncbi:AAA family ATPase [Sorangium sp. So ce1389]|uniref:AAA family ATPase n=1 Tax=Sorangium sp. So ce1389 TaxID=3133336 RepID=UPI003F618B15
MRFSHIKLDNWRNFRRVDVPLGQRVFIFGPNASGKSNLLDAFRFLHDIAEEQGGLRRAVDEKRRGIKYLRSLHARNNSDVAIDVRVELGEGEPEWRYALTLQGDAKGKVTVKREIIEHGERLVHERPDDLDRADPARLSQTHLEQVSANQGFRPLAHFLASVEYIHIVPQLVRDPGRADVMGKDVFGADFLEQMARTPKKQRESKLRRIHQAMTAALPQFEELRLERDEVGRPHLEAKYAHWRPRGAWQREDQFSDGTLRLLGLLWVLLDGASPLILEEPELSLHAAVVAQIPRMLARLTRRTNRQVILSTHSAELMAERGIDPSEVLILEATDEDTRVTPASEYEEIVAIAESDQPIADLLIGRTRPRNVERLSVLGG